jgi:hypothetical protein
MSVKDLLGNSLSVGDLVSIKQDMLVGVVVRVEEGTIAKGVTIGKQPSGEVLPQHLIVKLELTTVIPAIGGAANVLKLASPEDGKKELIH